MVERKGFVRAIDDRLGLSALKYPIPKSANSYGYTLGAMSIFSFVIMGVSGTILAQFYSPSPENANSSVAYISSNGFLLYIRGIHWWTALMIPLLLQLHMLRIVITGSYKQNREGTWYIGLFLYLTSLFMVFTGTVLKYDQEGFEALEHFVAAVKMFGIFGMPLSPALTSSTSFLVRIFALHVSTLPIVLLILIVFHLILIKIHGISPLPGEEGTWENETNVTFVDHLKVATFYSGILFLLLSILAVIFPRTAAPEAISGIEATRPPWIFLPLYPLENWIGLIAIVIFPAIFALILVIIPIIDRGQSRDPRKGMRKLAVALMVSLILFIVFFSVLSAFVEPVSHFG